MSGPNWWFSAVLVVWLMANSFFLFVLILPLQRALVLKGPLLTPCGWMKTSSGLANISCKNYQILALKIMAFDDHLSKDSFIYKDIQNWPRNSSHVPETPKCFFSFRREKVGILRVKIASRDSMESILLFSQPTWQFYMYMVCSSVSSECPERLYDGECKHTPFPRHYLWPYLLCVFYIQLECRPTSCSSSCQVPVTIHWTVWNLGKSCSKNNVHLIF